MFWRENPPMKEAIDLMDSTFKKNVKYPVRKSDWTKEYVPVWELDKGFVKSQIRFHKNIISESEYLLSLLQ